MNKNTLHQSGDISEPLTPMQKLLERYHSKAAIGRLVGLERSSITPWGDYVPKNYAYRIEVVSNGEFKAVDLMRPQENVKEV